MEVKGKYHDIGYFFYEVSKLDRIVNIENISMEPAKRRSGGAQNDYRLKAKFSTVTFKFIDEAKTPVDEKGKKKKKKKKRKKRKR